MLNRPRVIVNGEIMEAANASLLISDLAIQRGYGVFDFFKTINGSPIFLEDHLDRLYRSAENMHLDFGFDRHSLKAILFELISINDMPQSGVKITVTGGYAADGYTLDKPNLLITQQPLVLYNDANTPPLKVVSYEHQRQMPHIKTIDYLMAIWLQPFIKQNKADDVLYHNNRLITECPRSNFFIVTNDGVLVTPVSNVLYGITRTQILRHFKHLCAIEERNISLEEVCHAKEAFVTNSSKNILPVIKVDEHFIGNGETGPLTLKIKKELLELIASETSNAVFFR
ncbi:MAG: aminotransferase class IV [Chitinophagaceae bacterium]|nr:aminotransferase class IV [Chitinophagaceae bacterium]